MTENKPKTGAWKKGQSGNPGGRPTLTPEQKDAKAALRLLGPDVVARLKQLLQSDDEKVSAQVALGMAKMVGLDEPQRLEVTAAVAASPAAGASAEELAEMLDVARERVRARATAAARTDAPEDSAPVPGVAGRPPSTGRP